MHTNDWSFSRIFLFSASLLASLLPAAAPAQSVLGQQEIKDISIGEVVYPYESLDSGGRITYMAHLPAIKLSEGEFAYLWKPQRKSERMRIVALYNVVMQERWQTSFKLEVGEEVIHLFRNEEDLIVMSYEYEWQNREHMVYIRKLDLLTGDHGERERLFSHKADVNRELFFDFSPDGQQFIVYHYDRFDAVKSFNLLYDYLYSDERLGHRANRAEMVRYSRYNTRLEALGKGQIPINPDGSPRIWAMGCQLDNAGNIYTTLYEEKTTLSIIQYNVATGTSEKLSFDGYPNMYRMTDPFDTHLPVEVGNFEKAYVTIAEREKRGGKKQLQELNLITFDFRAGVVDERRKVNVNSSLLVGVAKHKRAFGLKADKSFDNYLIKEIVEMPDQSVWLITQRYEYSYLGGGFYETRSLANSQASRIEEVILYDFSPEGNFRKAVVVPSFQQADHAKDLAGHFYTLNVDRDSYEMHFITHERSGENLKGPHRIFYRKVDLKTGDATPRKILYEGEKKGQGFYKLYTVWLSSSVVAMLVEDGYNGKTYAVSVAVEQ